MDLFGLGPVESGEFGFGVLHLTWKGVGAHPLCHAASTTAFFYPVHVLYHVLKNE